MYVCAAAPGLDVVPDPLLVAALEIPYAPAVNPSATAAMPTTRGTDRLPDSLLICKTFLLGDWTPWGEA
jgi:hypothetical protein